MKTQHGKLRAKDLRNDARAPLGLGCSSCPLLETCGGLQLPSGSFSCMDMCCGKPDQCDSLCFAKPKELSRRVLEVQGFDLDSVPRSRRLEAPVLPSVVPLLYHSSSRTRVFSQETVALNLYDVVSKLGELDTPEDLARRSLFEPGARVVLTGGDKDRRLERWWAKGAHSRRAYAARLARLGATLVTTPNFSLFLNTPRLDDLHSIKRIAIAQQDFVSAGLPAALHLNAITDRDWERWAHYVRDRGEIECVSMEFGTGANGERRRWHINNLLAFADFVKRPLDLIVRGARAELLTLTETFRHVTFLDTSVFPRTMKRQSASLDASGRITWSAQHTLRGEPLDDLLEHNWCVVHEAMMFMFCTDEEVT